MNLWSGVSVTDQKKPKRNKHYAGKDIRNTEIMALAAQGKTQGQIAKEIGLSRQRVGRILNSDDAKELVKDARSRLHEMLTDAVDTIGDALSGRKKDDGKIDSWGLKTALTAALATLKGTGVLTEQLEIKQPKPTVIQLIGDDAKAIVLGNEEEKE